MKEIRKNRLAGLLASRPYNGDRASFCSSAGITKGRLSQLLDPDEPFGDVAAKNLTDALGLNPRYFDRPENSPAAEPIEYQREAPQPALPVVTDPAKFDVVLVTVAALFRSIPQEQWNEALLDVSATLLKRLPRR